MRWDKLFAIYLWKRNHILIEFQPMGANRRSWVQIDNRGCNARGMGANPY